jgi:RAT1-interacting protein
VTTTQSFKTIHVPRLVRGKQGAWDPLVCLEWGHQFLTFLKDAIQKDVDPSEQRVPIWRVKFVPGTGVSVETLDHIGIEDVRGNEERVGFLPTWYWDELQTSSTHMDPRPREGGDYPIKPRSDAPLANAGWQI